MNILQAIIDGALFGRFFEGGDTWRSWFTVLRCIFGLPLGADEFALFAKCTGRARPFEKPITEGWLICGRRSGKSFIAALIAVYLAAFRDYTPYLAPGERGVVMVLAVDRDQAKVIFRYIVAFFEAVPMLAEMIVARTSDTLELSNRIAIEVQTSSFRSVRGRTLVAALCDEIAFWRDDSSANPDEAVLDALRPAMATIPGALLLCLSSPYARRGALFKAVEKHFAQDRSDVLIWRAETLTMNPTIPASTVQRAYEDDPTAAASEYGAEFRSDVQAFLDEEWISDAIDVGCHERAPMSRSTKYVCFVDPSGGKRDSFTFGVAHRSGESLVLDIAREWRAPLDPGPVVDEIATIVKPYGITRVTGDAYGGAWPQNAFRAAGLAYEVSEASRSEIYLETGPLLAQGRIRLVDNPRLAAQLRQLERRTSRSGRDSVNHPPGGHDDVANAALGALWLASKLSARAASTHGLRRFAYAEM